MDFTKTTDNELALMLQLESTRKDLLGQAVLRAQAEITVAQHEMQGVQERARAVMQEQERRDAEKQKAPEKPAE